MEGDRIVNITFTARSADALTSLAATLDFMMNVGA